MRQWPYQNNLLTGVHPIWYHIWILLLCPSWRIQINGKKNSGKKPLKSKIVGTSLECLDTVILEALFCQLLKNILFILDTLLKQILWIFLILLKRRLCKQVLIILLDTTPHPLSFSSFKEGKTTVVKKPKTIYILKDPLSWHDFHICFPTSLPLSLCFSYRGGVDSEGRPVMVIVGAHFLLKCLDLERFILHVVKVWAYCLDYYDHQRLSTLHNAQGPIIYINIKWFGYTCISLFMTAFHFSILGVWVIDTEALYYCLFPFCSIFTTVSTLLSLFISCNE